MSKALGRLLGRYKEEPMAIQAKVTFISGNTIEQSYEDLYLEWTRGQNTDSSAPFGSIENGKLEISLALIFEKLSIFFRQVNSEAPIYRQKDSTMSLLCRQPNGKKLLLGQANLELTPYVGLQNQDVELRLAGGPLMNGIIYMSISICLFKDVKKILGIEPSTLKTEKRQLEL